MLKSHSLHNSTVRVKTGVCSMCSSNTTVPLIKGLCKSHYWQSKPKKQKTVERKPIRKMSSKRSQETAKYLKERLNHLNENPNCEVCGCSATEIHHKKGRLGILLYDRSYFMSVDRKCHDKIENNPEWAKEQGYSINRL